MEQAKLAWELITKAVGTYKGQGTNHEKQNFEGKLELTQVVTDKLFVLQSTATGSSGEIFHQEYSTIGFDITGELKLFVSSNNHPAITIHPFHRLEESADSKSVVFRFGNREDKNSFREEVKFTLHADGNITHFYSWGMPGGEFEPRSGSRMVRV